MPEAFPDLLRHISCTLSGETQDIAERVLGGKRLTYDEALALWYQADLSLMVALAGTVRSRLHGTKAFFNRNIHIEPTNICVRKCSFCSYYRNSGDPEAWDLSLEEILGSILQHPDITEVHITGGLHPEKDLAWYCQLLGKISEAFPQVHIKALTAEEIDYLSRKSRLSIAQVISELKACGLKSIPGGGAEIFHPEVRTMICPEKIRGERWLEIHQTAHQLGLTSNATMLFGHVERPEHRLHHMLQIRNLQDLTAGFHAFIPLKFKSFHNALSSLGETCFADVTKTFAMARILLDNVPHLKAYWPMLGKEKAALMLHFGADDLDGTIHDSTKIYAMAGAEEKNPALAPSDIIKLIRAEGFDPVERDSRYNEI